MNTSNATAKQISCIGALCSRLNISTENKVIMVQGFSAGRCTSSKELKTYEALKLIQHLMDMLPAQKDKSKMMRYIYSMCHEVGWTKTNTQGQKVADGKRFDEWATKNSYLKKSLDKYSYEELPKLVSQFQQVYKHLISKRPHST
jgi:hypothetical protein